MRHNYEEMTQSEVQDLLRQWRESNERRSEDVMELYLSLNLESYVNVQELHVVLEQVLYAALDTHDYGVANYCILLLSQEFPGSLRVMRYQAALLEAKEKYEEALQILLHIIKVDETNSAARKRIVAIEKAQGDIKSAIIELVDYLKEFMSDVEAWQELCSLYLRAQEYARAAFCAEELLLHQPHSHLHHQRLADIRYTMGGVENMEIAKSYYCQALKLNPDNMRALLGLFLTTNNLVNQYKSSGSAGKRAEAWKLCQWAQAAATRKQRAARAAAATTAARPAPLHQAMLALAITD